MNSRKLACLSIVLALVLTFGAWVRAQYRQTVSAPTLQIPLYGAALADPPAQPPADDHRLARLEAKVDKIHEAVSRLLRLAEEEIAATPAAAKPPANVQAALNSAATKCAACHSPANAAQKGEGFVMFQEGQQTGTLNFAPLGVGARKRIHDKIAKDEMPKPPHVLLPDEKSAMLAAFVPVATVTK